MNEISIAQVALSVSVYEAKAGIRPCCQDGQGDMNSVAFVVSVPVVKKSFRDIESTRRPRAAQMPFRVFPTAAGAMHSCGC